MRLFPRKIIPEPGSIQKMEVQMASSKSRPVNLGTDLVLSTIFLFLNPAPLEDGKVVEEGESTRANTPWFVNIPALGVSVMARDSKGAPVTGYWKDQDAVSWASGLWNRLTADPKLLGQVKANPEWPDKIDPSFKMMIRIADVPRPVARE
jgi:hypothetical protein